ncbi:6-phosphogluconate dehydrogenase [Sesbania bispinosa]|nr:6-phosphogluconate dehydrogenase [Sesbania bispinosa]
MVAPPCSTKFAALQAKVVAAARTLKYTSRSHFLITGVHLNCTTIALPPLQSQIVIVPEKKRLFYV